MLLLLFNEGFKTLDLISHELQVALVSLGGSLPKVLLEVLKHESDLKGISEMVVTYAILWILLAHFKHHWLQNIVDISLKPELVLVGSLLSLSLVTASIVTVH